jgi:hypothetical protein
MIVDEQETAFGQTADILLKQGGFADSPGSVQMEQSPIGKIGMLLHDGQQVAAAYEERFGSLGQPVLNLHSIPVTPDFRSIINGNSRSVARQKGEKGDGCHACRALGPVRGKSSDSAEEDIAGLSERLWYNG